MVRYLSPCNYKVNERKRLLMKCLRRFEWVKLLRSHLPEGKGILAYWAKLASRAAFRKGMGIYCGYENPVIPGMWSGGIVGLKSILEIKSTKQAIWTLKKLADLDYLRCEYDRKTKKLTYCVLDWVVKCNGAECMDSTVYTSQGYGFLCIPRTITERLVKQNYIFEEADAWLDLWCHTVLEEPNNAFSFLAPSIQYGKYGAVLTLETLGNRWGWSKTKVWRFFKKYGDVFSLYRLPRACGCLIINKLYPTGYDWVEPTNEDIADVLKKLKRASCWMEKYGSDNEHINRLVAYYSRRTEPKKSSVSLLNTDSLYIRRRAYLSLCRNCKNYIYDCLSIGLYNSVVYQKSIRGPCGFRVKLE